MDGTRILACAIFFCSLSKQDKDLGKQKGAGAKIILIEEGRTKTMTCIDNKVLNVIKATYEGEEIICRYNDVTSIVRTKCQGRHRCSLKATDETYTDSCFIFDERLRVEYSCEEQLVTETQDKQSTYRFKGALLEDSTKITRGEVCSTCTPNQDCIKDRRTSRYHCVIYWTQTLDICKQWGCTRATLISTKATDITLTQTSTETSTKAMETTSNQMSTTETSTQTTWTTSIQTSTETPTLETSTETTGTTSTQTSKESSNEATEKTITQTSTETLTEAILTTSIQASSETSTEATATTLIQTSAKTSTKAIETSSIQRSTENLNEATYTTLTQTSTETSTKAIEITSIEMTTETSTEATGTPSTQASTETATTESSTEATDTTYIQTSTEILTHGSKPLSITVTVPTVTTTENVEVDFGESTTLFCSSTSNQLPLRSMLWQKKSSSGGQIITKEYQQTTDGKLHKANISYVINNAKESDGGEYYCTASNEKGNSSVKVLMKVNDKDECKDKNPCPQMCENTFGSYNCRCWEGYNGDGRRCLINVDQIGKYFKSICLRVTIKGDGIWNNNLTDITTLYYRLLSRNFSAAMKTLLGHLPHYRETRIISFSQGNVLGSVQIYSFIIVEKSANTTFYYDQISQNSNIFSSFMPGRVDITQTNNDWASLGCIQSVNITGNRTLSLHEGEDIKIKCEAEAVTVTGKLDFSWTLNGYFVRPTRSSRIKITSSKTGAVKYESALHISNFSQSDEGNVICTAVIGNHRQDTNATVMMYRFILEISNTAVKTGDNITATCTVYPETELASNSLKFCIDKKPVEADDNTKIKYDKNKAVLTKISLTRDISITCGFTAKEQCSQHTETRIAVFGPEYCPCPKQTEEKYLKWPETFPGLTATIKCLPGFTGMISRKCRKDGYNGTWLHPSFTYCTREEIAEVKNKLDRIKDGVGVDKLVNVIREFKNASEEIAQTNLTASDVRAGVQVLATMSEIITSREENITVEETEEFLYATDVILSGESKDSWQNLYNETKDNSAARVMDIVGNISNRAMENLVVDKPILVNGKNIVLLIERSNFSAIVFPKNKTSEITSEVELSEETIKKSLNVNSSVRYSTAYYKTLGDFLPNSLGKEEIGSTILAFSLPKSDILRQLDPPIRMTFKTKETNLTERLCSYWNQKKGVWSDDGCWATAVNETFTECKCNHLTNFAVLISVKEISQDHHEAMSVISLVGFITSIVFLIVTVAVYIHYWRYLKSDKAVMLMIMCIILILAYLTFIIGIETTENKNACTAVAVTLHYLFLVFMCLMASEGIIHAVLVVFQRRQSIIRILIPMSFGVPLVIVAVSGAITQLDGYGTEKFCWLATDKGLIYSFLGPCYAVVIINLVITGLLFKTLYSTKATMNKSKREKIRTGIRSLLVLAPVFGLTWLFGFFSFHDDVNAFAYLFVIFNSLQGLLIFIMHTFMNQTVKKQMTRTISKLRKKKEKVTTSDTSSTKKKIRDKASTDAQSTADGAGLMSSTSDSTHE